MTEIYLYLSKLRTTPYFYLFACYSLFILNYKLSKNSIFSFSLYIVSSKEYAWTILHILGGNNKSK
jgi:hypothetical protein